MQRTESTLHSAVLSWYRHNQTERHDFFYLLTYSVIYYNLPHELGCQMDKEFIKSDW